MSFARGTTPTISITFSATKYATLDLTTATNIIVTLASGSKKINKGANDLEISEKRIDVYLTQQDTLGFSKEVEVQANWLTADNKRMATKPKVLDVGRQLYERVMDNA